MLTIGHQVGHVIGVHVTDKKLVSQITIQLRLLRKYIGKNLNFALPLQPSKRRGG